MLIRNTFRIVIKSRLHFNTATLESGRYLEGGRGAYKVMCFFGLQVDGLITERVYKGAEREKLLSGS